jgi:hypothetical protein
LLSAFDAATPLPFHDYAFAELMLIMPLRFDEPLIISPFSTIADS